MIICTNCGNHNGDEDEFCGSCGKFLEWVGQKVEEPVVEAPAEPEPEPEEVKVGLLDRVKAAVGIEGDGGTPPSPSSATASPSAGTATPAPAAPSPAEPAPEVEPAPAAEAAPAVDGEAEAAAAAAAAAARQKAEEEEAARRRSEEEAAAAAAAAAAQKAAEEEAARREAEEKAAAAEAEAARQRREAEAAAAETGRRQAEEKAAADAAAAAKTEAELQAAAAAAAAQAAETDERRRREAEAAAAAKAAEEAAADEARKKAEAEEAQRRQQEEERQRREAEARAEAARRAAALLAQPRTEAPTAPSATPSATPVKKAAGPVHASAPTHKSSAPVAPAASAAPVAPEARKAVAPGQEPARPKAPPKPATQIKVDEGPKPGDLICTECGTGNDPTRKFCRRCGNSLAKAEPVKKIPWWKRLFARKPKQAKKGSTGGMTGRKAAREAQYRTRMVMATMRKAVFMLAAFGIAVPFLIPSLRGSIFSGVGNGISSAREKLFPSFASVNAINVAATSELPEHPAAHAGDLAVNTYWAEGSPDAGLGQGLSFTFQGPQELARMIITPGATDVAGSFLKEPRPKTIRLTYDSGGTQDLTLKDELKAQTFTLKNAKGVTKVDIAIVDVYAGQGGQNTSIAEVEFKAKG